MQFSTVLMVILSMFVVSTMMIIQLREEITSARLSVGAGWARNSSIVMTNTSLRQKAGLMMMMVLVLVAVLTISRRVCSCRKGEHRL
jgi:hypothetical protein